LKFLHFKRSLIYAALAVIILVGVYLFARKPSAVPDNTLATHTAQALLLETDTDNDGLKDWQETLWNTDFHNPDTDGDGTRDGVEVRENRDPTKKGPDDVLPAPKAEVPADDKYEYSFDKSAGSSFTDLLVINLLSNYAQAKGNGALNGTTQEEMISNLLRDARGTVTLDTYSSENLSVTPFATASTYINYYNKLGIVVTTKQTGVGDEIQILAEVIQTDNYTGMVRLAPIAAVYKRTAENILNLPVPSALSSAHLALANSYYAVSQTLANMAATDDPTAMLVNLGYYREAYDSMTSAFGSLRVYALTNDLDSRLNEYGKAIVATH